MSILGYTRDTLAVIALEKRFGLLREAYMRRTIDTGLPDEAYMSGEEQRILETVKQSYYTPEAGRLVDPEASEPLSATDQYENRGTELAEDAVIMCHRMLADIPFVGHPDWNEAPP